MIGPWTRITEDYFTALLADLAVVLMVRLRTNHSTRTRTQWPITFHSDITDQSQHTRTRHTRHNISKTKINFR